MYFSLGYLCTFFMSTHMPVFRTVYCQHNNLSLAYWMLSIYILVYGHLINCQEVNRDVIDSRGELSYRLFCRLVYLIFVDLSNPQWKHLDLQTGFLISFQNNSDKFQVIHFVRTINPLAYKSVFMVKLYGECKLVLC